MEGCVVHIADQKDAQHRFIKVNEELLSAVRKLKALGADAEPDMVIGDAAMWTDR
eukprot:gene2336-742_t